MILYSRGIKDSIKLEISLISKDWGIKFTVFFDLKKKPNLNEFNVVDECVGRVFI